MYARYRVVAFGFLAWCGLSHYIFVIADSEGAAALKVIHAVTGAIASVAQWLSLRVLAFRL
jgi:hypothetical protein